MRELEQEVFQVSGGDPLMAINTFVAVFGFPAAIIASIDVYNDLGRAIGESVFNQLNPDPLGQMVFTQADFKSNF